MEKTLNKIWMILKIGVAVRLVWYVVAAPVVNGISKIAQVGKFKKEALEGLEEGQEAVLYPPCA